jgi:hypothetical protein
MNTLQNWGIERFTRFKTKVWKHLEESSHLEGFLARYFEFYPNSPVELLDLIENLDSRAKKELFMFLKQNLVILVGRVQRQLKQTREAKEAKEPKKTKETKDKKEKENPDDQTNFLWSV